MALFDTLKNLVSGAQEKSKQSQFEELLSDHKTITLLERYLTPKDKELQTQLIGLIGDGKIGKVNSVLNKIYSGLGQNTYAEKLDVLQKFLSPDGENRNLGISERKRSALAMVLSVSGYLVLNKNVHGYIQESNAETEALMPSKNKTMSLVNRIIHNKKIREVFRGK